MIQSYSKPQLLIREVLQVLPNVTLPSLNAFVFGPQFDLFRYYVAAERASMKGVAFAYNQNTSSSAAQIVPFEGLKPNHVVDASFVKLFGEKLEGQLWAATSSKGNPPTGLYYFQIPNLSVANQILVAVAPAQISVAPAGSSDINGNTQMATVTVFNQGQGYTPNSTLIVPVVDSSGANPGQGAVVQLTVNGTGNVASGIVISSGSGYNSFGAIFMKVPSPQGGANVGLADGTLIPELKGRPIQTGDILYTTCNSLTYRRVVQSVIQQIQPASIGASGNGLFSAAASNPIEQDSFVFKNATAPFAWGLGLAKVDLLSVAVTAGGTGYTTASVATVSAPSVVNAGLSGAGVAAWTTVQATVSLTISGSAIASVQVGEPGFGYFDHGVTLIPVSAGGSGYTVAPTVFVPAPADTINGVQAKAVAHIASGAVTAIEIISPGAGYTSVPTATLTGGNGSGATLGTVTVVAPPTITSVSVGSGATFVTKVHSLASDWSGLVQGSIYQNTYGERYTITCTTAGTTGALYRIRTASGAFSADNVVPTVLGNYFVLTDPALGGLAIELHATVGQGAELGDTFSFVVLGKYIPLTLAPTGQVIAVNVLNSGTGYSANGVITFVAPPTGGRIAKAKIATVTSGAITGITILDPGQGYVYPPAVAAIAGGTGALLQSVISTAANSCDLAIVPGTTYNGQVDTRYLVQVVEGTNPGGQNSFTGATVLVSDTAGIDTQREIVVQHGVNYNLGSFGLQFTFPSNVISPSGLPGSTATATIAAVDVNGAITSVAITGAGFGYATAPTITITTAGGDSAELQAILNNGIIEDVIVISGGEGYSTSDTLALSAPTVYQPGLRTGDVYYIDANAAAPGGAYNTIVLNGLATDITGWAPTDVLINYFDIDTRLLYTGQIAAQGDPADAPNLAWTVGASGIAVKYNLKINVPARSDGFQWVPVQASAYARLFASWRGLVPATGTNAPRASQYPYFSTAAIIATFGANDPDNPVCYGACIAWNAGSGKMVYVSSLPSNDLAGYTAVLNQAARVQGPYCLAPMTEDPAVIQAVKVHVDSCSTFATKLWRRAYVATESPGKFAVYDINSNGDSLQGSVLTDGIGNVRVVAPTAVFVDEEVQPGDLYRTYFVADAWGNQTYQEFPIFEVLENTELILSTGPTAPITSPIRFEIWRPDTSTSQATHVGNVSAALDDRRVINVWTDNPVVLSAASGDFVQTPVMFLSAEIAGLRAALLPQQGITNSILQFSVNAVPTMYTKFADADLDIAAANGTFIVTQDSQGGIIYIRHQLTTDTNDGNLAFEDSVGTSFDSLAYKIKFALQPYIGQRNATPQVVEELDVRMRRILDDEKKAPVNLSNIGPALVDWSNLFIEIDQTLRDKINISVTLTYPLPLNTIDVTLNATIIQGEVSTVTLVTTQSPTS